MKRFTARPYFQPAEEKLRYLPEGPRLLADGRLGWVAINHGDGSDTGSVNVLDLASGKNRSIPVPGRPGFFAETTTKDTVLCGMERRLVLLNLATGEVTETGVAATADERTIINDGLAVPGGVLFGTKHLSFSEPVASLFHFHAGTGRVEEVLGGQICSNGKFFHEDVLIDIDSQPRTITRYAMYQGTWKVRERDVVIAPGKLPGVPDGMRPTASGDSVVVAFYNPDEVADGRAWEIRLSDGEVLTEWVVPGSPRVTCPEIALIDGKVMLILTTAVEGMPAGTRAKAVEAGTMFIAETDFAEAPARPPEVEWGAEAPEICVLGAE